jgi:hypothetical protein
MNHKNLSIRFQGERYLLVPTTGEDGDIYTKEQYEQQLMSYAILRDGVIWRHHKVVGFQREIEVLGEDNTQIVIGPLTALLRTVEAIEIMADPLRQFARDKAMKESAAENQAKIDAERDKGSL